ncbi:SREBP regulating gene protein [Balamuthia mandrillaris]
MDVRLAPDVETPEDFLIGVNERPERFYGLSYDNYAQWEAFYSDFSSERHSRRERKRKRRRVRRLFLAMLAAILVAILLALVYYIWATSQEETRRPRTEWWYVLLLRSLRGDRSAQPSAGLPLGGGAFKPSQQQPGDYAGDGKTTGMEGAVGQLEGEGGAEEGDGGEQTCRNTVQGKEWLTDDKGFVCRRKDQMDVERRHCCQTSQQTGIPRFSCYSCNQTTHCCAVYEYCVSCCLGPAQVQVVGGSLLQSKVGGEALAANRDLLFDVCLALCRTSSSSVVDQHHYKSPQKHCFGGWSQSAAPTDANGKRMKREASG